MSEHSTSAKYFLIAVVALAVAVAIYVAIQHRRAHPEHAAKPQMTATEQNYLSKIQVTNPSVSAASNFLGATVYYLDGEIDNHGSGNVRALDLSLSFMDPFGEVLSRRVEHVITTANPPLQAGASVPLHLTFEHVPGAWNQAPPVISPVYIQLENAKSR